MFQPILLVALRLAGEQEAALRSHYGDAVLPGAVPTGAGRQPGGGAVTVVLVTQERLTFGKGVLARDGSKTEDKTLVDSGHGVRK